jgi:hypothetical protein
MHESELIAGRVELGIDLVTGSSAAAGVLGTASCVPLGLTSAYCITHRRSRLALTPCRSAIRATETPGRLHSSAKARLAATLYVRRPFDPCFVTSPATTSTLFSDMVSTF